MTFAAILADCYRRLNYASTPVADVVTRIKADVNEVHERILSHPSLRSLLYSTMPFTSTASIARYGLSNVAQIRSFIDTENQITLQPRNLAWYRTRNPSPTTNEGTPAWYIPIGTVATTSAIAATGLWAVSSSASDTAITVNIDATRTGGYPHSVASTTLNGLTRVAIGGASALTDYIDVTQFALSAAAVGDVSLYDAASSGTLLAVIPRGQTTSRYWGFRLCLTPSEALTYTLDIEHELFPLTADTDEPLLPVRFHRLLGMGVRAIEYEKTSDARYGMAQQQFDEGMRELLYQVTCPPGFTVVPGGGTRDSMGSNLGPFFPSGRW
jgi:hypothetical protein